MKGGRPDGYTIVEVMIVLAVSGVMFVIAASFINGRQARAAFTQGTTDMSSAIQTMISQINDGQYSDQAIRCTPGPSSYSFAYSTDKQGQSDKCMFLGKVMHFWPAGDKSKYEVFTVIGRRSNFSTGSLVQDLNGAIPYTVSPHGVAGRPDLTAKHSISQGLEVYGVNAYDTSGAVHTNLYAFGLLQSLGSYDTTGSLQSGTQNVGLYFIPSVTANANQDTASLQIDSSPANYRPAARMVICLTDGTRYAQVNIGTANNILSVYTDLSKTSGTCLN